MLQLGYVQISPIHVLPPPCCAPGEFLLNRRRKLFVLKKTHLNCLFLNHSRILTTSHQILLLGFVFSGFHSLCSRVKPQWARDGITTNSFDLQANTNLLRFYLGNRCSSASAVTNTELQHCQYLFFQVRQQIL